MIPPRLLIPFNFLHVLYPLSLILGLLLTPSLAGTAQDAPKLQYFGELGCAHCDRFQEKTLPRAEAETGIQAEASYHDILSQEGYERCESLLEQRGYTFSIFPVLIIGNNAYQGDTAIKENLTAELTYFARQGSYRPRLEKTTSPASAPSVKAEGAWALVPIFLAGLVDGINPCAFATMLFFLSWITLRGGSRRRILLCGLSFIGGVFTAYMLIGFGLFSVFRAASQLAVLRRGTRYLFTGLSLILAGVAFRDSLLLRRGEPSRTWLQLPLGLKKRIHRVIRSRPRDGRISAAASVLSFASAGILVSFLELACTGQIYFPTITYMVQNSGGKGSPLFLLLLYNTAFIVPLAGVMILVLAGREQQGIQRVFTRHLSAGKAVMGLLFAGLALLIWFSG